ncbi:MAG: hypothetical protein U5L96_14345 [Owenweeksia sp.]|nr:hypothetical protein [Owenweeksia sp.]
MATIVRLRYNEPRAMLQALQERGIPEEHIVMDYAGFRTLDSMVRALKVFGQDEFIVIVPTLSPTSGRSI